MSPRETLIKALTQVRFRADLTIEQRAEILDVATGYSEVCAALTDVMGLITEGKLVRDTDSDYEGGWAIRQLPVVVALKRADAALSKSRGETKAEVGA